MLDPKYKIGDLVYCINTRHTQKSHPCPDCLGEKKWTAKSPAGGEFEFACPRCSGSYASYRDISLGYTWFEPSIEQLTIGSVRTDTASKDRPIEYMCVETGVGSGSIYDEKKLFSDKEEANKEAQKLADKHNKESERVIEQFDASLKISDYELDNAVLEEAKTIKRKNETSLRDLFYNLEDIETIKDCKEIIENFEFK